MVFFLRAIEGDDGRWSCKRGRYTLDLHSHPGLEEAVEHLREIGRAAEGAVQIVAHFRDGSVHMLESEG